MVGTIYKIESNVNKKVYIGLSFRLKRRWYEHQFELKKGTHGNKHLQSHYDKHGGDVFDYSIVWQGECEPEELFNKEQHYITLYNSFDKTKGFNMNKGGIGSLGLIPTTRKLNKEQVLHIKRLLFFKTFQISRLSKSMGIPIDAVINIRDKDYYKEWTLSFDHYEQYEEYKELAKYYRCFSSVKKINKVYFWLLDNPEATYIPNKIEKNIHSVLKTNVRLRTDYEHGHKIIYIEDRLRNNVELKERKAETVLLRYLEGKTTREISDETNITQTYINGIINGDKLGEYCLSIREKVSQKREQEENSIKELVESIFELYIKHKRNNLPITQNEIAEILGIKKSKVGGILRGENFKKYSEPYLKELSTL